MGPLVRVADIHSLVPFLPVTESIPGHWNLVFLCFWVGHSVHPTLTVPGNPYADSHPS